MLIHVVCAILALTPDDPARPARGDTSVPLDSGARAKPGAFDRDAALGGDPIALAAARELDRRELAAELDRAKQELNDIPAMTPPPRRGASPPDPYAERRATAKAKVKRLGDELEATARAADEAESKLAPAKRTRIADLKDEPLRELVAVAQRRHEIKTRFTSETHGLGVGAVEGALQVLGQVVVEKAVEAGWEVLSERLKALAECPGAKEADPDRAGKRFPNVCTALGQDIHDVIAQPDILVHAAILDLLHESPAAELLVSLTDNFKVTWEGLRTAWRADRARGVGAYLGISLQTSVVNIYADHPDCPVAAQLPLKAAWILGKCIVDGFSTCNVAARADDCKLMDAEAQRTVAAVTASAGLKKPRDAVNTLFELTRLGLTAPEPLKIAGEDWPPDLEVREVRARRLLDLLQGLVIGLLDQDTTRAMAAAAELAVELFKIRAHQGQDSEEEKRIRTFYYLLAGAARYASVQGSAEEKQAARKEVVKELITRLTRRANRTSGAVVSLGGSFGVVGGARLAVAKFERAAPASMVHLGVGFGLDTYHARQRGGFHLELTPLDLGQYVAFKNSALTVEKPDLKAAIAPSLKVGGHFVLKATPLYTALFVGVSPFVRETAAAGDRMTMSVGAILGVYVPFLDFN